MAAAVLGAALLAGQPALAWDAATTHAGITERALAAAHLHSVLAHQLGRALGAFEPLRLVPSAVDHDTLWALEHRLADLDAAGGYRPGADGTLTAAGWIKAGAVLAKTPPELGRNHYLEPATRTGLDDGPSLSGAWHAARLTVGSGATVRDAATGLAFDLEGMPATQWIESPHNDLGVPSFWDNWQSAIRAPLPSERETALVRSLLALGGILSVLEDMGQPAFVRNDFRGEFPEWGSRFEEFVADRFGAVALPPSLPMVSRPDLASFFVAADGKGLAQATQARFFSAGTLPPDLVCSGGDGPEEAAKLVNQSLKFPEPKFDAIDLSPSTTHYLVQSGIKVAAYRRVGDTIHFFLDQDVYAAVADAWLPMITAYAAGLIDHMLRGKLEVELANGQATVTLSGINGSPGKETALHLLTEDAGVRRELAVAYLDGRSSLTLSLPTGTHKVAAFASGVDASGRFVATGEATAP
jgi:hypothetical protein